jgi:hypothetical protein
LWLGMLKEKGAGHVLGETQDVEVESVPGRMEY